MERSDETKRLADRGIALWKSGHAHEAVEILIPLALANPGDAGLQALVGFVYYDGKQFAEAVPHLERALAANPAYELATRALFHCFWEQGDHERGLAVARRLAALTNDQDDLRMLANLEAQYGAA